ncbi:hypothetical protein [Nocardia sp. NPDC052112]|uniref:hypothetical protein n=1 Tax=Nocardia sp. NPDC052112 TaxID=3155646 RepID=UPI00344607BE
MTHGRLGRNVHCSRVHRGIIAVGALGTPAGRILMTAPVAIGAAIQYFTTINQPMPAPK